MANKYLERAQSAAASDAQLASLETAIAEGEVSFELARNALDNYFECLDLVGVHYVFEGTSGGGRFPEIDYSVASIAPPAESCYEREYKFLDMLYQLQPVADGYADDAIRAHTDEAVDCLADVGYVFDSDPTIDELRDALFRAYLGQHAGDDEGVPDSGAAKDCLGVVGLTIDDL